MGMGHRYRIKDEKYTFLQKIQTKVLSSAGSRIKMGRIIEWKRKLVDRQNKKAKKYCMNVTTGVKGMSLPYKSGWYDAVVYQQYRDRKLPVPREYDKHLTLQYGNYMEPVKDWELYIRHFTDENGDAESKG